MSAASADEVWQQAGMPLQVARHEVWNPSGSAAAGDQVTVFRACDPTWVRPEDLAPHKTWYNDLFRWTAAASEHQGCLLLTKPTQCVNAVPLLSDKCPTLPIVWHLKRQGWRSQSGRVDHTFAVVGDFDCTGATQMKSY